MPAPVNPSSAAVVDVILSNHARGYRNQEFISHKLFPRASIPMRSMRVIRFGKDGFRLISTRRAPGGQIKTVQFGYESDPVGLAQDSLQGLVPVEFQEEARKVPGIDLGANAVNSVMDIMDLGLEVEIANLARDANQYSANNKLALAGASQWSDPGSDPHGDVTAAKEAIRAMIGRYPNVLEIGAPVFNALQKHPLIKDQFKYTSSQSITAAMLAAYFDVAEVVVGRAVYLPENADDDQPATDVWGKDAILAFVPNQASGNYLVPAYGYTYELSGYPQVETPWYDRDYRSWKYPTTIERRPYLVGAEGGFLFQSAAA